eukprot:snap_masked-scaffold_21-processed-gene-5.43-mRNA-1 protein AED:1.00 eAED:1.00 QI:0/0/0/0/1/1/3/0/215
MSSFDPSSKKRFRIIQVAIVTIEILIPILVVVMIILTADAFIAMVLSLPLYVIGITILWFSKKRFSALLEGSYTAKLRYQGKILHEVFYKLCISFTVFEIFAIPVIIFLFVVSNPVDYNFVVPPEGQINFLLSGAQILRSLITLYITYVVMLYLIRARRVPRSKSRILRSITMVKPKTGGTENSFFENPFPVKEPKEFYCFFEQKRKIVSLVALM